MELVVNVRKRNLVIMQQIPFVDVASGLSLIFGISLKVDIRISPMA